MPLRLKSKVGRRGRLSSALSSWTGSVTGTNGAAPTVSGTISALIYDWVGAITGVYQASSAVAGTIQQTLAGWVGSITGTTQTSVGWQLASGHFIPAKMAPNIIHPRTDAEMNAYARACRCPSGIEWSIPISVQGGAWPFYYELVSGPSGMTIGSTLPGDWLTNGLQNYGVLSWSSPTVGSHSVSVRVTDQDGTQTTRSWTLEVLDRENTAYFIFVDAATGSNSNSGAYSSPKLDIEGWYGTSYTQVTYPNRQVFYRAGTYTVSAAWPVNYKWDHRPANKPCVFVGYPGESVTLRMGTGFPSCYVDWSSSSGDICYQNLRWENPQSWADIGSGYVNYRKCFFRCPTSGHRVLFFDNVFDGGGDTRADDSTNSAAIFFSGGPGNYHAVVHNTFHNLDGMDTVLLYDNQDNVFEGNLISGTYGGSYGSKPWGYFIKGTTPSNSVRRISVRANRHDGSSKGRQLVFCSEYTGRYKGEIEVCWNNYWGLGDFTESGVAGSGCFGIGQGPTNPATYGSFWSYRNNWKGPHMSVISMQSGSNSWESDVIQHDGAYTDGISVYNSTGSTMTKTNLASGTSAVITLDASTNLLTGAARTSYLGTHGCEVA